MSITFYHREAKSAMDISELENKVAEIMAKPTRLICITKAGTTRTMSISECKATGARFLCVDCTEADTVLGLELGGDAEYP